MMPPIMMERSNHSSCSKVLKSTGRGRPTGNSVEGDLASYRLARFENGALAYHGELAYHARYISYKSEPLVELFGCNRLPI